MKPSKLAQRDSIRVFELNGQAVAIVAGKKSQDCQQQKLVKMRNRFDLVCICETDCDGPATETYFIVQAMGPILRTREIKVRHIGGIDSVPVTRLDPNEVATEAKRPILGVSQDFSLEAAFKDALRKIAPNPGKEPNLVEVVALGALYGGFSGFSRLFVGVSAVPEISREFRAKQKQDLT